jgi:hypothetical protein
MRRRIPGAVATKSSSAGGHETVLVMLRSWSDDDGFGSRRHVLPMYEFTTQLATLEPPPPKLQQLLGAMQGNQEAMNGFAPVNAGMTSPAQFFSEENVAYIFASGGKRLAS